MQKPQRTSCEKCGRRFRNQQEATNHPKTPECIAVRAEARLYDKGLAPVPMHFEGTFKQANVEFVEGVSWNDTLKIQQKMLWVEAGVVVFCLNSQFRSLPHHLQVYSLKRQNEDPNFLEAFNVARRFDAGGGIDFIKQQWEHERTERICGSQPAKTSKVS